MESRNASQNRGWDCPAQIAICSVDKKSPAPSGAELFDSTRNYDFRKSSKMPLLMRY